MPARSKQRQTEGIDLKEFYTAIEQAAKDASFQIDRLHGETNTPLLLLTHRTECRASCIYLSAGIHGDEPVGPASLLQLLQNGSFAKNVNWCLFPLLNPEGASRFHRGNAAGIDINRDYRHLATPEATRHVEWLKSDHVRFDLAICLHEDCDAKGYYLYEFNPLEQPSLADPVLSAVDPIVGVDASPMIEGYPSKNGVLHPTLALDIRPQWPESCYLLTHHCPLVYTFESPSKAPFESRVDAHVAAVDAAIQEFLEKRLQ